jgi:hypothetical protein
MDNFNYLHIILQQNKILGRFKIYVNFHFHYALVQIEGFNGTWFIPSCFGVCHTANGEMKR